MKPVSDEVKASVAFWWRHCMTVAADELARIALQRSCDAQDLRQKVAGMPRPRR